MWEARLVVCTGFGVVTADEVLEVDDRMVKEAQGFSSLTTALNVK